MLRCYLSKDAGFVDCSDLLPIVEEKSIFISHQCEGRRP
jgi:hypothetical protein